MGREMLQAIYRIVVIEKRVREPFSSHCLAPYLEGISQDRIASFLTRYSAASSKSQAPIFIRVFRGRYRFNESRLEELEVGQGREDHERKRLNAPPRPE